MKILPRQCETSLQSWSIVSVGGHSEVWNQPDVVTTCEDEALSIFKPGSSFANWAVS